MEHDDEQGRPRYTPSARRVLPQFRFRPQWWNWAGLKRSIDRRIESHGPEALPADAVKGLRYFWLDSVFAALSDNLIVSFIGVFLLAYGATNGQIGLLSAVANLFGMMALFPGAAHADRVRHRKRLVLLTGASFGRLLILPLILLPLLNPGAQVAIWAVILINAGRNFLGSYANPAWTGLVADLVPSQRRGRFFSERNFTMGIAALAMSLAGGVIIRRLNGVGGMEHLGFQVAFTGALLFAAASTISFMRIPEPDNTGRPKEGEPKVPLGGILKKHPEYLAFLAGALIWNLSIQTAAPFFNIYLITELGGTVESVGIAAGITSIAGLGGQLFFGRRSSRKGSLVVIRDAGLIIPLIPILWGFTNQPWQVYVLSALVGFAWAGYNLANFNLLLELAPSEARSRAVALYQAVVFATAVAGPLLGGVLIDLLSYRAVFVSTGIGRLVGISLFLLLIRRHADKVKG